MQSWCCCTRDSNAKTITDDVHVDTDHVANAAERSAGRMSEEEPKNQNITAEQKQNQRSREGLPEAEKERLRKMSKEFMKEAMIGQPCQLLDPTREAKPEDCVYKIDKALSAFTVQANDNTRHRFDITDLMAVSKDSAGTPFADIEVKDFVCISIRGDGGPHGPRQDLPALQHVGLLFPNSSKQDEFFVCMQLVKKMRSVVSPPSSPREPLSQDDNICTTLVPPG